MPLTEHDKTLLIETLCCVVAADGRVSGREVAVIAEALTQAGCPTTREDIRPLVIEMSKQIHAPGVRRYTDSLGAKLASLRGTDLASVMHKSLIALMMADGKATDQETEIIRQFRQAVSDALPPATNGTQDVSPADSVATTVTQRPWYTPLLAAGGVWLAALALLVIARGCVGADTRVHESMRRSDYRDFQRSVEYADFCESQYRKSGTPRDFAKWGAEADKTGAKATKLYSATVAGMPSNYPIWLGCILAIALTATVALFLLYKPQPVADSDPLGRHGESLFLFLSLTLLLLLCLLLYAIWSQSSWYAGDGATAAQSSKALSRAVRHIEAVLAEHMRLGGGLDALTTGEKSAFWKRHKELVARSNAEVESILRGEELRSRMSFGEWEKEGHCSENSSLRCREQWERRHEVINETIGIQASARARLIERLVADGAIVTGQSFEPQAEDVKSILTSVGWRKSNGLIWRFRPSGEVLVEEPGGTVDESRTWRLLERNEDKRFIAVMVSEAGTDDTTYQRRWEFRFEYDYDLRGLDLVSRYARVKTFQKSEMMSDDMFSAVPSAIAGEESGHAEATAAPQNSSTSASDGAGRKSAARNPDEAARSRGMAMAVGETKNQDEAATYTATCMILASGLMRVSYLNETGGQSVREVTGPDEVEVTHPIGRVSGFSVTPRDRNTSVTLMLMVNGVHVRTANGGPGEAVSIGGRGE